MGEVRREKALQLELTKMRNPYLEEGVGSTPRRRQETARSHPRAKGRFANAGAYADAGSRRTGAGAYSKASVRGGSRRTGAGAYSRASAQGGSGRMGAGAYSKTSGQNRERWVNTDMSPQADGHAGAGHGESGTYAQAGRGRRGGAYTQSVRVEAEAYLQTAGRGARRREAERELQRRLKQRQRRRTLTVVMMACIATVCLFWWLTGLFLRKGGVPVNAGGTVSAGDSLPQQKVQAAPEPQKPDWTEDYLTPNEYSRPGEPLPKVDNIFVHYTANVGTSAVQNRSYFENLKDNHERKASSHFIIGYEGEILQIIPLDEIACAVQSRNYDSISIECCYLAEDGSFTQETYDSLIELLAYLVQIYDLEPEDILRHYDSGGKKCPLYYTEHEDAWEKLKADVAAKIAEYRS